ncbi:phage tail protein [Sphaerisporangium perillae]|uniref:phage tail protein n=1 Tax=Sphaerisporangium perillae TaxID=2935860 RepID=UPI00200F1AD8|nr:phage tail protein [Sphaerisporangium perillae]
MALPDPDSSVGLSFGLEIGGIVIKQIDEVSGLKMEQDVIEVKENTPDGKYVIEKLTGRPKPGEVTLVRGRTSDDGFEKWVKESQSGRTGDARKSGAIIVFDDAGNPIKRYKLLNAWPKSLEISASKAGDTSVLTEKLVITYEQMEME